ncbi:hypothetical protein DH86_00000364 [Scytalidium sp. 3C]|nr:hypothetical protein DH86_00000364 [Scytalidium sp. 3C]
MIDVLSQLTSTRSLFNSYLRIRSLSTSATSPELNSARSDLQWAIDSLSEDLGDLAESVKAIEADPYKFGLEVEEVVRRKRLVEEVGGEVEDMKEELTKNGASAQKPGGAAGAASGMQDGLQGEQPRDDYAEFEQQQQLHMMAEQDQQLDGVFRTVGNLRQQADDMGRELEEQGELLEVVDGLADRVGGRLQTGLKNMGTLVKKNEDRFSSCCIAVLIFVLIFLLILVLVL